MMRRLLSKFLWRLMLAVAFGLVGLGWLWPHVAGSSQSPTLIATAPEPPRLVPAILNGAPVHVLYVTRSSDRVLVRCYPGFAPTIALRTMGNNAGQQEGVLTCVAPQ